MEVKTPGENLARISYLNAPGESFEKEMLHTGGVGGVLDEDEKKEVDVRPVGGPERDSVNQDGPGAIWSRMYVLTEVPWDPSQPPGALLYSVRVPSVSIPDGPPTAIYNSFTFARMRSITFSFSLSSTVTTQGQVVAFFCPLLTDPATYTLKEILLLPHILIKAGRTTAGMLEVPWVHPLNALEIQSPVAWRQQLGTVAIVVFNQFRMGASAGTQSPTINVGIQFNDMELSVPSPNAPSLIGAYRRPRLGLSS